jgi:hypothetical protein
MIFVAKFSNLSREEVKILKHIGNTLKDFYEAVGQIWELQ